MTKPSSARRPAVWLYATGIGFTALVLALVGVLGISGVSALWRKTGRVAPKGVRQSAALRQLFTGRPYRQLMKEVARERPESFQTVWDVDIGVSLSRDLYDEVEMYGQKRYRYRSHVRALDVAVWSGVAYQSLLVPETPSIVEAVSKCDIVQKAVFSTDEHGFKVGGFPIKPGTPTVLFVGDSFTEGLHVSAEDTFSDRFGRLARDAKLPIVPVNAGVNGYGTLEEAWTIETWAGRLGTVLVVANLFPNDVSDNFIDVIEGRIPDAKYDEMLGWLDKARLFCREHGIAFAVAVIPVSSQLATTGRSPFETRVDAWCRKSDVMFLDPLESFRAIGPRALYFDWDPHLHAAGHDTYARFLFERLRPTLEKALAARR